MSSSPRSNRGSRRPPAAQTSSSAAMSNNTPPPLLLMNPGKGLTMDVVLGDNVPLLVPTTSNEAINANHAPTSSSSVPEPTTVADVDLANYEVEDLQASSTGNFLGGTPGFPPLKPPSAIPSFASANFFGSSKRDSVPFIIGGSNSSTPRETVTPPQRPSSAHSNASTSSSSGMKPAVSSLPPPSTGTAAGPFTMSSALPPPPSALPKSLSSSQLNKTPFSHLPNATFPPSSASSSAISSMAPPPPQQSPFAAATSLFTPLQQQPQPPPPSFNGIYPSSLPPPPPLASSSFAQQQQQQPPPPPFNPTPQSASDVILKNYDPPPNVAPPPKAPVSAGTSFRLNQGTLGQRVHHDVIATNGGVGGGHLHSSQTPSPAQQLFSPPAFVPLPSSQSHTDLLSGSGNNSMAPPPLPNGASSLPMTPSESAPSAVGYAPPPMNAALPPPMSAATEAVTASPHHTTPTTAQAYVPVSHHWFYCKQVESKKVWHPFTWIDSMGLEEALNEVACEEEDEDLGPLIISTDGNRHDVNMETRLRESVYWHEPPAEVRRCSWFFKGDADNRFVPYEEDFADQLEEYFREAMTTGVWHQRLEFPGGEIIVMHSPHAMVHFMPNSEPDEWGTVQEGQSRPRVVKRGLDDTFIDVIEDGESEEIDHLLFVCHGIGPVCDLRFRSIYECVDGMRHIHEGLLDAHFKPHRESGRIGRLEFLPISWHEALHGDASGVDAALKQITLGSIGRLRNFTNSTLLDILFYTSPKYCQHIAETVVGEINRLYALFLERNPTFAGQVSLIGHSLGSLILFDILQHQKDEEFEEGEEEREEGTDVADQQGEIEEQQLAEEDAVDDEAIEDEAAVEELNDVLERLGIGDVAPLLEAEQIDLETLMICGESDLKELGIAMGPRKKLLAYVGDKLLEEKKKEAAAANAVLAAQQAAAQLEEEETLSLAMTQQPSSVSISHVSYKVGLAGTGQPFVKYPKLAFIPVGCFALGSPIGMFLTVRGLDHIGVDFKLPNCPNFFNVFHPFDPVAYRVEPLIHPHLKLRPVVIPHHKGRKRLHLELKESLASLGTNIKAQVMDSLRSTWSTISEFAKSHMTTASAIEGAVDQMVEEVKGDGGSGGHNMYVASEISSTQTEDDVDMGALNGGRRVDFVLQEAPFESLNEYMFAFASHLCYWESEDTVLFMCKEIYSWHGVNVVNVVKADSPPKSLGHDASPPPSVQVGYGNAGGGEHASSATPTTLAPMIPPPMQSPPMQPAPSPMMMMAPPPPSQGGLPFITVPHASGGAYQPHNKLGHFSPPPPTMASPFGATSAPMPAAAPVLVGPPPTSGFFRK